MMAIVKIMVMMAIVKIMVMMVVLVVIMMVVLVVVMMVVVTDDGGHDTMIMVVRLTNSFSSFQKQTT